MIKYILMQIILLILLLTPFVSKAQSCNDLFSSTHIQKTEIQKIFEKFLFNDNIIEGIDDIRRQYDDSSEGVKLGASIRIVSLLKELKDVALGELKNENEETLAENGFFNTVQDLVHISPRYLSSRRIVSENIAIMAALIAIQNGKSTNFTRDGNVFTLSGDRFRRNSSYIAARRVVFDFIDAYQIHDYVPTVIKGERIEELLLADARYSSLPSTERAMLASRILIDIEKSSYEGVESILERYFATR